MQRIGGWNKGKGKVNNMRKETIRVSETDLMFVIAGQLFDQAPNRQPRKSEIIMQKVRDSFRKIADNHNERYTFCVEKDKLYVWFHDLLFAIPEFRELNLTQIEFEKGISVDDENRPPFKFSTRYDVETSESWKYDFIDLDAFIQNVNYEYNRIFNAEHDCYMCIHQDRGSKSTLDCGSSDSCKNCLVNPNLKNNFETCRHPRGEHTFACKYDCPKNRYICCEECKEKDSCEYVCDSKSDDCGQKINQKKNK